MFLAVGDGSVNELGVLGLLGSGKNQGRVGGGILRLVLADGCEREALVSVSMSLELGERTGKVTGVAHDDLKAKVSSLFPAARTARNEG
jgi:hypothetical protein